MIPPLPMSRNTATILAVLIMAICSAGLAAEFADYTPVDRELSNQALLAAVDASTPGLKAFAEARRRGDLATAQALLVSHFRGRRTPVLPPVAFPGGHSGNSMVVLQGSKAHQAEADAKWLKHIYTSRNNDEGTTETHQLGDPIDWYDNPSKGLSWLLYINQLNLVSKLAAIWRDTGEDRYALEAGKLVQSWTHQCWRGYCYIRDGKLVNSGMEVRNRLTNCIAAYDVLRTCPALTGEMHMAFWKLFVTHARELVEWAPGGTHKHPLVAYPGLFAVAVLFPEFAESADWMETGMRSLQDSIVDRITPEGAWQTHSSSYQEVPYAWSLRSLEILRASGDGSTDATAALIRTQITKMMELQFRMALPNGGWPNVGDTYGRSDWGAAMSSVLKMYIWLRFDEQEQARLNRIAVAYERMLAALAMASGAKGNAPREPSVGLTGSGYYAMRSGWFGKQQRYLYYDLTPQAFGHAHLDAAHVEIYAYGKPLVTDTGDYFLGWGSRTALHNTIEVDGTMQQWRAEMMPCEWLTTRTVDLMDGAHLGYGQRGITHRRKAIFFKGDPDGFADYWLLADLLTGKGEHTYEQFFHLAGPDPVTSPTIELDPTTLIAKTVHANTANVTIVPVGGAGLQGGFFEPIETDLDPKAKTERAAMLGWMVGNGSFQRVKSPALVYTRTGTPPQSYHTVVLPTPEGAHATAIVTRLPVTRNGTVVPASEAVGLTCQVTMTRRAHASAEIIVESGPNLALGCVATARINQGSIGKGPAVRLTDGNLAPTTIGGAVSSSPYQPKVALSARFVIDLGKEIEINRLVIHDGVWNGSKTLYPASQLRVQHTTDDTWHDLETAPHVREQPDAVTIGFDALVARRIAVLVERPDGGRIAIREVQAYRISDAERARVAKLREDTVTDRWTDFILISHSSPEPTQYGDFAFDGQLAVLRHDQDGQLRRMSLVRARALAAGPDQLFIADPIRDYVGATWAGDELQLNGPACQGLRIATGKARAIAVAGQTIPCLPNTLFPVPVQPGPGLHITDAIAQFHPPQKGLAGGQPWALVTWETSLPATSQVEFQTADGPLRRTPLSSQPTRSHRCRIEFLRPNHTYQLTAVSVLPSGVRATHPVPPGEVNDEPKPQP
jgi:hypothetical protein